MALYVEEEPKNAKVWGAVYEFAGEKYSIAIYGTEEEAEAHVQQLGLTDLQQITAHIDYSMEVHKQERLN
jgi:hypothetical protein